MQIYTPNLQLIRYVGDTPRKLWEIKARNVPTLNKGDIVLIDAVSAVLMTKKYGFELVVTGSLEFVEDENSADENQNEQGQDEQGQDTTYSLPLALEINELSDDEVRTACKYVGVSVSNKKIDTLKSILLPYLPKE